VYVGSHFKLEEDLMAEFDFGGLPPHRDSHEKLTAKVEQMVDQFHLGGFDALELINFLESWLVNHVLKVDQLLADFLNSSQQATG
jgi:hemerythrin